MSIVSAILSKVEFLVGWGGVVWPNILSIRVFELRGGTSMIALLGRLVCLSVKKMSKYSKWLKQRILTWSWKQKLSVRLSRPLILSLDTLLCLYVGLSTHILTHTYSWLQIPGALCSTLVVLVLIVIRIRIKTSLWQYL